MSTEKSFTTAPVRIANPDDVAAIESLINSSFRKAEGFFLDGDRVDTGAVRNYLGKGLFLLAERAGKLLGCVYVESRPNARAYLGLLAVDLTLQQSGVGSLLMEAAEAHCRNLGSRFMDINVVNLREELPRFYQKRGYVETGTSPFPDDVETKIPCHFIEMTKAL